jgi:hypothetical protein
MEGILASLKAGLRVVKFGEPPRVVKGKGFFDLRAEVGGMSMARTSGRPEGLPYVG